MPLRKFVDLGHSDSHCHPVVNACTTEMQVTGLVPRPSTPHTTWMGHSVESPSAHLTMFHSCMLMQLQDFPLPLITTYYNVVATVTTHRTKSHKRCRFH